MSKNTPTLSPYFSFSNRSRRSWLILPRRKTLSFLRVLLLESLPSQGTIYEEQLWLLKHAEHTSIRSLTPAMWFFFFFLIYFIAFDRHDIFAVILSMIANQFHWVGRRLLWKLQKKFLLILPQKGQIKAFSKLAKFLSLSFLFLFLKTIWINQISIQYSRSYLML